VAVVFDNPKVTACYAKSGSPSLLGIAEFMVPIGSFFHAQTYVSSHIIEELSPNVRMSPVWTVKWVRVAGSSSHLGNLGL